jgi:hypothetical protein
LLLIANHTAQILIPQVHTFIHELPIIWYIFSLQASSADDDDDDDVDLFGEETEEEKAAAEARAAAVKASSKKKECMPACIFFHSEHNS